MTTTTASALLPSDAAVPTGRNRAPVVLVDMDGVIADLEGAFWTAFNAVNPQAPTREQVDPAAFRLDDQVGAQWADAAQAILRSPGFYSMLRPMPHAAEALNAMLAGGWDVRICTAPKLSNPTCASDKLNWLDEHIGDGWSKRAIVAKDKTYVRGDILIDDKPTVDGDLDPTWQHVIFDAPYNATSPATVRLTSWAEFAATLPGVLGVELLA